MAIAETQEQVEAARAAYAAANPGASLYGEDITDTGSRQINSQTGTTFVPTYIDRNKFVTLTNAGAIAVTLPTPASLVMAPGESIDFAVLGAGMATFSAGAGATVHGTPSLVTRAQYSAVSAVALSGTAWLIVGDLA